MYFRVLSGWAIWRNESGAHERAVYDNCGCWDVQSRKTAWKYRNELRSVQLVHYEELILILWECTVKLSLQLSHSNVRFQTLCVDFGSLYLQSHPFLFLPYFSIFGFNLTSTVVHVTSTVVIFTKWTVQNCSYTSKCSKWTPNPPSLPSYPAIGRTSPRHSFIQIRTDFSFTPLHPALHFLFGLITHIS